MRPQKPPLLLIITVVVGLVLAACSGLLDPDEPGNLVPKTVAEDPDLPRIAVNGTLLHAEAFGDIENPI
ncbi:MAG: alpha/beta hydrolase, partial [Fidelibacterota bacterium]